LIHQNRSINPITWIYITGKGTDEEKKEILHAYIEYDQDIEHDTPTDLKLTCMDNEFLLDHLTKLAIGLWQNFSPHEPMSLGHPPDKPYFRSYVDYLIKLVEAKDNLSSSSNSSQKEYVANQAKEKKSKRGPTTFTDERKLEAINKWENLASHSKPLEEWLVDEFGLNDYGFPNVVPATFHSWRKRLREKGLYKR
jgi:hypothetical protein